MLSAGCSPRMSRRAGPSRLSRSRRWTATRCAPPMSRRVPTNLRIVAEIPAGAGFGGIVGKGETARIFTGAPLPEGADTIVIQEDTERDGDTVRVVEGAPLGRYVRRAGLDFSEGDVLASCRDALDPAPYRPCGGDEPAVAVCPPPTDGRHPLDRRRGGDAGRADRTASDRQLERVGAGGVRHRLRRRAGRARQRARRRRRAAPLRRRGSRRRFAGVDRRRLGRRARSGARRALAKTGWRSISGRSRCALANR